MAKVCWFVRQANQDLLISRNLSHARAGVLGLSEHWFLVWILDLISTLHSHQASDSGCYFWGEERGELYRWIRQHPGRTTKLNISWNDHPVGRGQQSSGKRLGQDTQAMGWEGPGRGDEKEGSLVGPHSPPSFYRETERDGESGETALGTRGP